jgi:hypothetical protein
MPHMLMVELCGREVTDRLNVRLSARESIALRPCLLALRGVNWLQGELYRDLPPTGAGARWLFRLMFREFLGHPRGTVRGAFTVPVHLRRRWGL